MPWKSETVMDQRIEFIVRAKLKEESFSELCREFEISRPTGYLWLKRYEQIGSIAGLQEKSRRPIRSPLKTEDELEEIVVEFRRKQGWGARKIQVLLAKEGHQLGAATIHRILVRKGLVNADEADRKATERFECDECNQMAQMDFKGEYRSEKARAIRYHFWMIVAGTRWAFGRWIAPKHKACTMR